VTISLEPAGQVEFSGAPLGSLRESCRELSAHRRELAAISDALGVSFLWLGLNPLHTLDELPLMPKQRYRIMDAYLPTRGAQARRMMRQSCSVQATFDFSDEADAVEKLRVGYGVSPIVTAIFANSPFLDRRATGYRSYRAHVWQHVDPDRSGTPAPFLRGDVSFAAYAQWLLDMPMFFVRREGRFVELHGLPFRRFLAEGAGDLRPTFGDWKLHISTAFPTVRLKQQLEVRGADATPPSLLCGLPALWMGLLYDAQARAEAIDLARALDGEDPAALTERIARHALCARLRRGAVGELAVELVEIARRGLARLAPDEPNPTGVRLLEPVRASVAEGCAPADHLIRAWEDAGGGAAGFAAVIRMSTDNGPDADAASPPPSVDRSRPE
jgi:glutamate--cysteine ligase